MVHNKRMFIISDPDCMFILTMYWTQCRTYTKSCIYIQGVWSASYHPSGMPEMEPVRSDRRQSTGRDFEPPFDWPVNRSRSDQPVGQSKYLLQITTGSVCKNFSVWNTNHKIQRLNLLTETAISSAYRDVDWSEVFGRLGRDAWKNYRSGWVMNFSLGSILGGGGPRIGAP